MSALESKVAVKNERPYPTLNRTVEVRRSDAEIRLNRCGSALSHEAGPMPSNHYCREFFDRAAPGLYKQEWQEGMNETGYSRPNHHEAERQRCPHVF